MSHINSIFELLDSMAQENNRDELKFSMVFEPVHENGNTRNNLTNITFKFEESIENIKFINSLKNRKTFPMDIQIYPLNCKISNNKSFLLFKEFNNYKCVDIDSGVHSNNNLPYPLHTLKDYHSKIFNASNITGISRQGELDIFKEYIKLPSISFVSEDPFLFLNIYKYLEKDNLKQFKTEFTFNYAWNDMLSTITNSHQLNFRYFDNHLLTKKFNENWNVFDGYESRGNAQFIFSIAKNSILSQAKLISNINYNYTKQVNLCAHHKKLVFLPAPGDKVEELKLFGSNQYLINSSDHGFIHYSKEINQYSYSGIYLKDLTNLYSDFEKNLIEEHPGIPKEGIDFLFRVSVTALMNTFYCLVDDDLKIIQEKIVFELLQLSNLFLNDLINKAPNFFENFNIVDMVNLNINVSSSLLRTRLENEEELNDYMDKNLSVVNSSLLSTSKFFSLISNNHENMQMLRQIPQIDLNKTNGDFVPLMSFIQQNIEPDEDKHLNFEQLDLKKTFKNPQEHFTYKVKNKNRLETSTIPSELWRMVPHTKKLDLILVDDTPLKGKKLKYLTKTAGTRVIIFNDMVGEFFFRNLNLDLFLTSDIKIRWLSEIDFTDAELGKTETVINTTIQGYELRPDDYLLQQHHSTTNLGYMTTAVSLDLEELNDISIVSVLIDKNFGIAQTSNTNLADTRYLNSSQSSLFYNSFSNFVKKIVKQKYQKEVRIIFCTKSMHSKLIKGPGIDFLDLRASKYYGKVSEIESSLSSRYEVSQDLVSIYTTLTFDMIRRSRIKANYDTSLFNININSSFKDVYDGVLPDILNKFTENDKLKDYPFVNFFINKTHPIIGLNKYRPRISSGSGGNIKTVFGIDLSEGLANHSFIDIKDMENKILELLFITKEYQSFDEGTQEDLEKYYGTSYMPEENMNHRLAHFKMSGSTNDVMAQLLTYNSGGLFEQEDYQKYLLKQFNNILINRFKYELNLKNEVIIQLFKLFRDFDKLIIDNYKDFYYNNTGVKLEIPEEEEKEEEEKT